MPSPTDKPLGIKSCRHLIELYFGIQMVTDLVESPPTDTAGVSQILLPDPRRIKYEIILANGDSLVTNTVSLSTIGGVDQPSAAVYTLGPSATIIIERTFFADLDAVTLPVWANNPSGDVAISTREVFLSPASEEQLVS